MNNHKYYYFNVLQLCSFLFLITGNCSLSAISSELFLMKVDYYSKIIGQRCGKPVLTVFSKAEVFYLLYI